MQSAASLALLTGPCKWPLSNVPGSPSNSEGCPEGRGTFFFGRGGSLVLSTPGKEDLWVFDKCFLPIVCDTASLPGSLSFPLLSSKAGS